MGAWGASGGVRPPAVAGSWYPGDGRELRRLLGELLDKVEAWDGEAPQAVIVPHAGYVYSGEVAAWGFTALQDRDYDRAFVLAPAHRAYLEGAAVAPHAAFRTPLGEMELDQDAAARLERASDLIRRTESAHERDHAVEAEVPFLQLLLPAARLVPIVIGQVDRAQVRELARVLADELGPRDLVVVSTDFTHYGSMFGYTPALGDDVEQGLRELDMGAWERIADGDAATFLRHRQETGITVCGARPLAVLMDLLGADGRYTLRRYDTSGAMTGDWSHSVSYVAALAHGAAWRGRGADQGDAGEDAASVGGDGDVDAGGGGMAPLDDREQATLLGLARESIAAHLEGREAPRLEDYDLTPRMRELGGTFVTLRADGRLRGCIGEIIPHRTLAENVRGRAVDSATRDPRFASMRREELDGVQIEISVLTPLQPVDGHEDIVLGRDGILLSHGHARAVFLPQVATEQGWDLETTLRQLSRKARLPRDAWRDPEARFEVFQAEVFEEDE